MSIRVVARSISRPVRKRLCRPGETERCGQVLAVFERACHLATPTGEIVALVTPQIGDGPLNIVVGDGSTGPFAAVDPGTPATLERDQLRIGRLQVDLGEAQVWEPRPDWKALRTRQAAIRSHLPFLHALCQSQAPAGSLLALLGGRRAPEGASLLELNNAAVHRAASALLRGWERGAARRADWQSVSQQPRRAVRRSEWHSDLEKGAAGLAGLGGGLTPAGDDFLMGAMVWAWLTHPTPEALCQALAETAAPRTTALSAAFLRAAARGECHADWHTLLAALSAGPDATETVNISMAVQHILSHGATSGADGLAGFLYLSRGTCYTLPHT